MAVVEDRVVGPVGLFDLIEGLRDQEIASFLSPDSAEQSEAAIVRRLDRLTRSLERLERDPEITTEALALFVRFWLTTTPPLPDDSQAAAKAKGKSATAGSFRRWRGDWRRDRLSQRSFHSTYQPPRTRKAAVGAAAFSALATNQSGHSVHGLSTSLVRDKDETALAVGRFWH